MPETYVPLYEPISPVTPPHPDPAGVPPWKWQQWIQQLQEIEPALYPTNTAAEQFLNQFDFPPLERTNRYDDLLFELNLQRNGMIPIWAVQYRNYNPSYVARPLTPTPAPHYAPSIEPQMGAAVDPHLADQPLDLSMASIPPNYAPAIEPQMGAAVDPHLADQPLDLSMASILPNSASSIEPHMAPNVEPNLVRAPQPTVHHDVSSFSIEPMAGPSTAPDIPFSIEPIAGPSTTPDSEPPTKRRRVENAVAAPSAANMGKQPYGLEGTDYENVISFRTTWTSSNPTYPLSHNRLEGVEGDVIDHLNDGIIGVNKKYPHRYVKLDIRGLGFFTLPGSVANELIYVNGNFIAELIKQRNPDGTPVIRRIIEPMAGSGTYSNWARTEGFQGKVIMSDINPLITLTHEAIVNDPDGVTQEIETIKTEIREIGNQCGIPFDENLSIKFEDLFPNNPESHFLLGKKGDTVNQAAVNRRRKIYNEFSQKRGERAENFRIKIHEFFNTILNNAASLQDGKIVFSSAQKNRLAALFYLTQNSANNNIVQINAIPDAAGKLKFNLPLYLLVSEHTKRKITVFSKVVHYPKLQFISKIHLNKQHQTEFLNQNGWKLLRQKQAGSGDLIIISGYFNNAFLSEEQYFKNIEEYVLPAAKNGAKILIVNKLSQEHKIKFSKLGFEVTEHRGEQILGKKTPEYLLAVKNVETVTANFKPFVKESPLIYGPLQRANAMSWEKYPVIESQQNHQTRFDGQVILVLENNPSVLRSASRLAGKHPGKSVIYYIDEAGKYRVVHGDPSKLRGDIRYQIVGHGRGDKSNLNHDTLAGYSAGELANIVKEFRDTLNVLHHPDNPDNVHRQANNPDYDITPSYISLVGCSLANKYAPTFGVALYNLGIRADIGARWLPISVSEPGNKRHWKKDKAKEIWVKSYNENDKRVLVWNQKYVLIDGIPTLEDLLIDDTASLIDDTTLLIDGTTLGAKVKRQLKVVRQLNQDRDYYSSFTPQERQELAGFFPNADGTFNPGLLTELTQDQRRFQLWCNEAELLLQLRGAHAQLAELTGQQALALSSAWNEQQVQAITAWKRVEAEQGGERVKIDLAPQALFIGDNSRYAIASATAAGIAWLDAHTQKGNQSENYLNGLNTYASLNEQSAEGALAENDHQRVQQFRQLFDDLLTTPDEYPTFFARQKLPTRFAEVTPGHYLLKIGSQVLTLSCRHDEQGKPRFTLYDPNIGAMHINDSRPSQQTLAASLQPYLATATDVSLYKVDIPAVRAHFSELTPLHNLLSDYQTEAQRLAVAEDITLSTVRIPVAVLSKMGARIDGKPFSLDHLERLTPTALAEQLRFDAKKLSRYLHQADYSNLETQQAVRFLRQQIPSSGSMEGLLIASNDQKVKTTVLSQLDIIRQQVSFKPPPAMQTPDAAGSHTPKLMLDIAPTLGEAVKNVPITHTNGRLQRFTSRAGNSMQGYGYLRSLADIAKYDKLLRSEGLTAEQRAALSFEKNLAVASFTSNIVIDMTQSGLGHWGSRLSQLGVRSGFKLQLARFGAPLLGALSSGFDIYQAIRSFSQLAQTTDPKLRQDLIMTGSLSVAGAILGISVPIAFAVGGTAASIAGPVGLALGAVLLLIGGIYSAVREVEEIKKIAHLTTGETITAGWRAFIGQDQSSDIQNQLARDAAKKQAESELSAQRLKNAIKRLRANINIETLYLSQGQVPLVGYPYKMITGSAERPLYQQLFGMGANQRDILWDRILPKDAERLDPAALARTVLAPDNVERPWRQDPYYSEGRIEDSKLKYYQVEWKETDDVVIGGGEISEGVLKKSFIGAFTQVGSFVTATDNASPTALLNLLQNDYHSVIGDFDGDGQLDVGYFSAQGFYLLKADGQGGYAERQKLSVAKKSQPDQPRRIEDLRMFSNGTVRTLVGDIDGDNLDDMAIINDDSGNVRLLIAQENGIFNEEVQQLTPIRLSDAVPLLMDIDKDGRADFISFTRPGTINISYGTAEGRFETAPSLSLSSLYLQQAKGSAPELVHYTHRVAGDINGDGYGDIVSVTAAGAVHTLLGSGNRAAPFHVLSEQQHEGIKTLGRNFNHAQIQLHDMNNDGRADLLVIQNNGDYSIAYGQTDGTFSAETIDRWREEKGKTVRYRQNRLTVRGEQQILGISKDQKGKNHLLSLDPTGSINAHPITSTPLDDTIAWFSLGGGRDSAIGERNRINYFEIGEDNKTFRGGRLADSFLLMGLMAPETASVLNGGPASNSIPDDADTIVAAAKPIEQTNATGYIINLERGTASYRLRKNQERLIARLKDIENAYGHSETGDELVGNSGNNILNGMGGRDKLIGNEGDDTLILSEGLAIGGIGIDTYRISQNQRIPDNMLSTGVTVTDTENGQEYSNVLLDYDLAALTHIELKGNALEIGLRNDSKKGTLLDLNNMYRLSADGKQKTLQHRYVIYTRDGLQISDWPATLHQDAAGNWPLPRLQAQYISETDQTRQAQLKKVSPADIQVQLQSINGQEQITVKIKGQSIGQPTVLPRFLQLARIETKFSTEMVGDEKDNRLSTTLLSADKENNQASHRYRQDRMQGKGGADNYLIGSEARSILIDNQDDGSSNGGRIAPDNLIVPWLLKEIRLKEEGNDIVLTHRDAPASHPTIRISKFKQSEQYRHLWLQAKDGAIAELCINAAGGVSLGQQIVPTAGNDFILVEHETTLIDKKIDLGAGNDIFLDATDVGYQIRGGQGNDSLQGGAGDDVYHYDKGDGHDSLLDRGGNDQLVFSSMINKEQIWLERQGNHLKVLINGRDSGDSVTIKQYYTQQAKKIETIKVNGYQLTGSNIDALAQAMSAFSAPKQGAGSPEPSLSTQLNQLWLALPVQAA